MIILEAHDWALSYDAKTKRCIIDFRLEHSTMRIAIDRARAQDLAAALQIYEPSLFDVVDADGVTEVMDVVTSAVEEKVQMLDAILKHEEAVKADPTKAHVSDELVTAVHEYLQANPLASFVDVMADFDLTDEETTIVIDRIKSVKMTKLLADRYGVES